MITLLRFVFVLGLTALVVSAAVTIRARRREAFGRSGPVIDDETIARIIEHGEVVVDDDEPLDIREIDDEERRFWSETWDEQGNDW